MRKQRRSSNPLPSDILLILPELGLEVDKVRNDEAWALCPNPKHPDRDASWSINLTSGEHFCFSCGWGGNFLILVERLKKYDQEKAEEWIRKRGGITVALKKLRGETGYTKKEAEAVTDADLALFETRIPKWALTERDLVQEACEEYGLRWDEKRDLWIIPIRDPFDGHLIGWQEKGDGHFRNVPDHVEKSHAVFGYHLLGDIAYLEESPLDAVRLRSYSVDGAVSGYGVHVSDFQLDLIVDQVKTLFVCLDNDAAGRSKEAKIWREYRHRTRLLFANYEHTSKKDHGEMTVQEIEYSLEHPITALRFRPDADH